MTFQRKAFLLEPGERLVLSHSAVTVAHRFTEFLDASGLDAEAVLFNPLCGIPIPLYARGAGGKLTRFADARASFLYHPVMWLPERTALRYQIRDAAEESGSRIETDDEWAIRVAMELTGSGLYDPVSGTWVDVLALHGVDIDNPVDEARVEAWQRGAADPILDSIDLGELIGDGAEDRWSLHASQSTAPVLIPAQWSIMASSLIDTIFEEGPALAPADRHRLLAVITDLAADLLSDVPANDAGVAFLDALLSVEALLRAPRINLGDVERQLVGLLAAERDNFALAVAVLDAAERE